MWLGLQATTSFSSCPTSSATNNGFRTRNLLHHTLAGYHRPNSSRTVQGSVFTANRTFILKLASNRNSAKTRATFGGDEEDQQSDSSGPVLIRDEQRSREVGDSIRVLKNAAKTRKVDVSEVLSALSVVEKAKLDPSGFLNTLGGSESPGRTWMLIFTAEKKLKGGKYFPVTAIQRFDAAGKRIENGVYLGPLGSLTFEGRLTWKGRMLAFIFECVRIKVGPLKPLEIGLGTRGEDREPSNKDPFFIWFYIDEEIAVARGRSGGTAFWCRCRRVSSA